MAELFILEMKRNKTGISVKTLSILLIILSFWVPLVGILMWLGNRKNNSKSAGMFALAAVLGFVANYILIYIRG